MISYCVAPPLISFSTLGSFHFIPICIIDLKKCQRFAMRSLDFLYCIVVVLAYFIFILHNIADSCVCATTTLPSSSVITVVVAAFATTATEQQQKPFPNNFRIKNHLYIRLSFHIFWVPPASNICDLYGQPSPSPSKCFPHHHLWPLIIVVTVWSYNL